MVGKLDLALRVGDGMHLPEVVADMLEWRLAVHHVVKNAAQRPYITAYANLAENSQRWTHAILPHR